MAFELWFDYNGFLNATIADETGKLLSTMTKQEAVIYIKKQYQNLLKNKYEVAFGNARSYFESKGIDSPADLKIFAESNQLLTHPVLDFVQVK